MVVRKLEQKEHIKTRSLYEEVFSEDSTSFVDYYYTEKTKDNQIYVLEEGEEIRAMIHLNPYRMYVNGQEKQLHYIVAVATKQEYRKRGYMGTLLKRVLIDMRAAGESFTYLMPAAEAIYLPYDFRTVYEQEHRYFRDKAAVFKEAGEADIPELTRSAQQHLIQNYQVFVYRDAAYYQRMMKEYQSDGGKLLVYYQNDKLADCCLQVAEEASEKPKIMVRILDLERMLMSLSLTSIMAVCFEVTDPIIEENNKCIVLSGTEYSGVMLMEGKKGNSEGMLTVSAIASLVFGVKSVDELCREEGIRMSKRMKDELGKIIPLSKIYINETV